MELHTGSEDDIYDPSLAEKFTSLVKHTKLYVIPDVGHKLDQNYVQGVIWKFSKCNS